MFSFIIIYSITITITIITEDCYRSSSFSIRRRQPFKQYFKSSVRGNGPCGVKVGTLPPRVRAGAASFASCYYCTEEYTMSWCVVEGEGKGKQKKAKYVLPFRQQQCLTINTIITSTGGINNAFQPTITINHPDMA